RRARVGERGRLHVLQVDDGALCLGDDLLADDDDVVGFHADAGSLDGVAELGCQVVAGPDHRDARHGDDGDGHAGGTPSVSSTAPASRAACAGECITVSVTRTRMPRACTAGAQRASAVSRTNRSISPAYRPATPRGETSRPRPRSMRCSGPRMGRPPTSGQMAAAGACLRRMARRMSGMARMGPTDTSGLDGAITMA